MILRRYLILLALLVFAACDSGDSGDYDVDVLSVEQVILDERGLPGLAFEIENTGELTLYSLGVTVTLEPPFAPDVDVEHETQNTVPLGVGQTTTIEVPLPSRASHDAYDCYRYRVSASDGAEVPEGQVGSVAFSRTYSGTCR